jgi:hypothetical protein
MVRRFPALCLLTSVTLATSAQFSDPAADLPAYHATAPDKDAKLPPLLTGAQLTGPAFHYAWQRKVYAQAAQIQRVLYQLPCFCRCDRALGHASLHSCFEGTHGATCTTCAQEEAYAYQMSKAGKSVEEIRRGIEAGAYHSVDLQAL